MHNSENPLEIIGAVIIATLVSLIFGLILDRAVGRRCR